MTLPSSLIASLVAAVAATTVFGVALEWATRPVPPRAAPRPEPIQPKAIRTESFTREVPRAPPLLPSPLLEAPPVAIPASPPPLLVERAPAAAPAAVALLVPKDVCARHNLRKVYTRGGRSWRCRRVQRTPHG
jgi:hypothetical protein